MGKKTVALVGNPNSGKTTFFNALTGSNQRVGNWPGVTVEKKEGLFKYNDQEYRVVDLPGTYSLGAYSEDEVVARDFILTGDPDVVINVVDATNIERNLYLTSQLLEMGKNVVIALNMVDEADKLKIRFDLKKLSKGLNMPVVPTVAAHGKGVDEVIAEAVKLMDKTPIENPIVYGDRIEEERGLIRDKLRSKSLKYPLDWISLKVLEGDEDIISYLVEEGFGWAKDYTSDDLDFELELIDKRYEFMHRSIKGGVQRPIEEAVTLTDKIDKVVTNKYLGIPIFALIMFLVFQITFAVGEDLLGEMAAGLVESLAESVAGLLVAINAPQWFVAFVAEGVFGGLGAVVEFVPLITVLYLLMGLLEDSGYMARAAYVMDNLMRKLGIQGKTFVSMIVGFGCNVPGIMSTRTLDNKKDRMIALLINPFMSCGAKIPIYSVFIAAFFPKNGGLVLFSMYFLGIIVALIMGKVFSKTLFKGESSYFIMELPPYRIPTLKNVLRNMWDNVSGFLKRAGTTIFIVVTMLWILARVPFGVEPFSESSILGSIGHFISPIFKPAGFGTWQASVSLFAGIPAKEAVIATLGMVYAGVSEGAALENAIRLHFTPLSAVSYMVMTLLYTPCVSVLATVKKETNSYKWMIFTALYTFFIGWVMAVLVFQVGGLLGFS